jgi:adenine-specific DNA-methyltransferase
VAAKIPKPTTPKPVDATRHPSDGRMNIPTAELEAFATDDEKRPKTVLYPRDPTLDPQLVWKGKDEQDAHPLAVPAVPIQIQETISPQALIEDLRAHSKANAPEAQLDFLSDFNGLPFEERVEFYRHSQHWTNRMILGDSLLVS